MGGGLASGRSPPRSRKRSPVARIVKYPSGPLPDVTNYNAEIPPTCLLPDVFSYSGQSFLTGSHIVGHRAPARARGFLSKWGLGSGRSPSRRGPAAPARLRGPPAPVILPKSQVVGLVVPNMINYNVLLSVSPGVGLLPNVTYSNVLLLGLLPNVINLLAVPSGLGTGT